MTTLTAHDGPVCTDVPAMGTTAEIRLTGPDAPRIEPILARLQQLEAIWSRFRPDSELSQLAAGDGHPTVVDHSTAMLLERAVWASRRTAGSFDPTVGTAIRAVGYDRDFDHLPEVATLGARMPAPGCDGIEVDPRIDLVRVPAGVTIDPGGIGKGLAADLLATDAVNDGATAALVSIGGDLRVAGDAPTDGWEIEVDHHIAPTARVNLRSGALATSSTIRRRWATTDGVAHHVIDPRTGRPSDGPVVACSVVATEAWWAEAIATALIVGWRSVGDNADLVDLLDDAGALLTFAGGDQLTIGPLDHAFSLGRSH